MRRILLAICLLGAPATAWAQSAAYIALTNPANLTFDDEFTTLNASPNGSAGWMTAYPWSGENARTSTSNHEAEYYSDLSVGADPFSVANGVLSITASLAASGSNPYGLPYTSGIITSYKSLNQTYGYFEIRAQMPLGQGLWPAFWLYPTALPTISELDVFEVLENAPTILYATTHDYETSTEDSQRLTVANTTTAFNTYGVDWEPATVTFYMNGHVIATAPTPSTMNLPMYMIANLAVGGAGSWPGAPSSAAEFPASYKIDYIRAYATPATKSLTGTEAIPAGLAAATSPPVVVVTPPVVTPPVVTPPVVTPPVVVATPAAAVDTIVLKLSEDAYQGDAQFVLSIDGHAVTTPQAVTAIHGAGATEVFSYGGTFGAGSHTIGVGFVNDAYGGSPALDRNLYIQGVTLNGASVFAGTKAQDSNGTSTWTASTMD